MATTVVSIAFWMTGELEFDTAILFCWSQNALQHGFA